MLRVVIIQTRFAFLPVVVLSLVATSALAETAPSAPAPAPAPASPAPAAPAAPTAAAPVAAAPAPAVSSAPAPSAPSAAPAAPSAAPAPAAPIAPPAAASATWPELAPVAVSARPAAEPYVVAAPAASYAETPSDELERRVVTFTDGGSPRLVSSGSTAVHGPIELEVRFRNANPLCYEYSTNLAASHIAASDQPLPDRVPGIGAFGATKVTSFATLDEALGAVNNAQTDLDETLNAARIQVSLDDVWAACDGGGEFAVERARVEAAARIAASRLGPDGEWREALENAEAVSLGAKRLAREMETGEQQAAQELEAKKAALVETERKEQAVRAEAAHGGHTKKIQAALDEAARDLAAAQRKAREAELNLARHRRAGDLGHAAERLGERVHHALELLSTSVADINRARSLLARSPTAIRRRFGAGETISIVVERTRLERGERVTGRGPQLFEGPTYRTLRPVILDLGIGPAVGLGHNNAKYAAVLSSGTDTDPGTAWRIERTDAGMPLDAVVSLSAYVWERRYFDDVVVDPMQLMPRPMIGMSVAHPLKQFYAGLQIDPIAFLDISAGVRFADEPKLLDLSEGDRALLDKSGAPQPPVTRSEIRASGFLSLTVSTNLLYSWLKQGL